uniref:Rab11 family GTPase n=1 Tax=Globisporangium ultimum (strain ATCC 200006 / CBS 805.95 / DAOM BR144) TaxID=431595 RepID=K3WUA3_GLOUD
MAAPSPRTSLTGAELASLLALAPSMAADDDSQFLPWKIAFRVQFQSDKLGLRFHPAHFPDTGNGVYTIRLLELTKVGPDGKGPAQIYNASLKPDQEHLALRPGLYLTHINDVHLLDVPCETVIQTLQSVPRPATLRFVDVEAGVVTPHELRDTLQLVPDSFAAISGGPSPATTPSKQQFAVPASPRGPGSGEAPIYKIILLGTTGVGKSSILAVGVHGDDGYAERRPTTLEPEFGSIEIPDPNLSNPNTIKARIWDTAGQERYRAITRSHYRRADGALLVYDVADPDSFTKLGEWLKTLQETAGDSLKCIMVVENKADQLSEATASHRSSASQRPSAFVQQVDVSAFCQMHGLLFARATAKMNATAFKWDAQRVGDIMRHLVLSIHASTLARTTNATSGLAPISVGPTRHGAENGGKVVLTDTPRAKGSASAMSSADCGSCGKNLN